ncbi:MAG: ribosome biogenesis GTPase Der [Candidatus Caldatribacteriaceae bacterium]
MNQKYPLVVITGRTNVGKSTLFNRLVEERVAIVDSVPGVTRDFLEKFVTIGRKTLRLIDTGGLEIFISPHNEIQRKMENKVWNLLENAQLVLLVVDGKKALTQIEWELSSRLRKFGLPVILVVNKREGMTNALLPAEFLQLGIEKVVQISAQHGDGIGTLKKMIQQMLPCEEVEKRDLVQNAIPVAIVGKPNVGKSSLYNAILGDERAIVSEIPGTTRDALFSFVETQYGKYVLFDTAGLTRRGKGEEGIPFYAHLRTMESIEKALICVLVLDPFQGITRQDQRIAQEIYQKQKCCLVFLNKMDLLKDNQRVNIGELVKNARIKLNFLAYAVFLAGSAFEEKTHHWLLSTMREVFARYHQMANSDTLNGKICLKLDRYLHGLLPGSHSSVERVVQEGVAPPRFVAYTRERDKNKRAYYALILEKVLRKEMNWEGVPLEIRVEQDHSGRTRRLW